MARITLRNVNGSALFELDQNNGAVRTFRHADKLIECLKANSIPARKITVDVQGLTDLCIFAVIPEFQRRFTVYAAA